MWNIIPLILGLTVINAFTDIMEPGPNSGIVLKENPGLLITNCRLHTQKVFVKINPREVCRRNLPLSDNQNEISWAGEKWDRIVVEHAEADVTYLLTQLQKFTVTQAELHGTDPRSRRAIGGLFTAASFVGSLFSLGLSAYNTVKLNAMQRHIGELQAELPDIRRTITKQQGQLQSIGRSLKGTILIVNTHSEVLNKTARAIDMLLSIINVDTVQTQMLTLLMGDMLRSISTSVENLATGRIPLHLVPLSLVESILTTSTKTEVTPLQAHLAWGSTNIGTALPRVYAR